jgi:hypothetical protein
MDSYEAIDSIAPAIKRFCDVLLSFCTYRKGCQAVSPGDRLGQKSDSLPQLLHRLDAVKL